MFRSLRFRLPALFLAAIVLAGLVSTAVAVSVSKRYAQTTLRKQAFRELGREARGITQIYTAHAGGNPPSSHELESASGDQIFYIRRAKGIDVFPGPTPAYTLLPRSILDFSRILAGDTVQFEFTRPGGKKRLLGFAMPVKLADKVFGAVILARPSTRLSQGWLPFVWRLSTSVGRVVQLSRRPRPARVPLSAYLCGLHAPALCLLRGALSPAWPRRCPAPS